MSVIDNLITDRSASDIERLNTIKQQIMSQGFNSLSTGEKQEYLAGMKGAYNYTDLNRVGAAVAYIAENLINAPDEITAYREERGVAHDVLFDLPYTPDEVDVQPKTNWTVSDIPTKEDASTYLANISNLRSILTLPSDTPAPPGNLNNLTYTIANNLEQILIAVDSTLTQLKAEKEHLIDLASIRCVYSGEAYAGEF